MWMALRNELVEDPLPMRYRWFVSVLVVFFLTHTALTYSVFLILACAPLQDTEEESRDWDRWFLVSDPTVECWTSSHERWVLGLAIPGILLYVLGVPFGAWWLMWRNRNAMQQPGHTQRTFLFMTSSYQPKFYYWECVIMLRKAAVAVMSLLLEAWGRDVQAIVAALVLFVATSVQLSWRPFASSHLNQAEQASLFISVATILAGLVATRPTVSPSVSTALGIVMVLMNVCFIGFMVAWAMRKLGRKLAQYMGRATCAGGCTCSTCGCSQRSPQLRRTGVTRAPPVPRQGNDESSWTATPTTNPMLRIGHKKFKRTVTKSSGRGTGMDQAQETSADARHARGRESFGSNTAAIHSPGIP